MIIKGGTGNGYAARVDEDNRLYTKAVSRSELGQKTVDAKSFIVRTSELPITNTLGFMVYIENTSSTDSFAINAYYLFWNGGDTNHNRSLYASVTVGAIAPTAGHTAAAVINPNTNSSATPELTAYQWDTVTGTGMTSTSSGIASGTAIIKSDFNFPLNGSVIIAPGQTLGVTARGDETGVCSFIVSGWFINADGV